MRFTRDQINQRVDYYCSYFEYMLGRDVEFILGSDIQSSPAYVDKLYEVVLEIQITKLRNNAPSLMKKTGESEKLSILYLVMQCLDPIFSNSDLIFAESNQKKIYDIIEFFKDRIDHFPPSVYINSATDIDGVNIHGSSSKSRISIHATEKIIKSKVRKMFAAPSSQKLPAGRKNALVEFYRWSVFPFLKNVKIENKRSNKVYHFRDFDEFHEVYKNDDLHPLDCKHTLKNILINRCQNIKDSIPAKYMNWIEIDRLT
jgi:tyrosyl-tRNA synthetase